MLPANLTSLFNKIFHIAVIQWYHLLKRLILTPLCLMLSLTKQILEPKQKKVTSHCQCNNKSDDRSKDLLKYNTRIHVLGKCKRKIAGNKELPAVLNVQALNAYSQLRP